MSSTDIRTDERQVKRTAAKVRIAVAVLVAVVVVALAKSRTLPFLDELIRFDRDVHQWAVDVRTPLLNAVMTALAITGAGAFVVVLMIAISAYLVRNKRWPDAVMLIASIVGGARLSDALKQFVARPRPEIQDHVTPVTTAAFPSGHAVQAVVCYLAIALLFRRRWVAVAGVVLAALVGLSRILLGVHWPSDVAGGYVIGACWLTIVWSLRILYAPAPEKQVAQKA